MEMPELPEVETVVRGLAKRITGRTIEWVHLNREDIIHGAAIPLCAALRGRRIRRVQRVGKQILIQPEGPRSLMIHLGMTGRLIAVHPETPIEPHTHLRITFRGCRLELRFYDPRRFGGVWLLDSEHPDEVGWIGRRRPPVGADALQLSLPEFRQRLRRHRQIKALLLDQESIGGIGNIYCDESLYRAGLHPKTSADRLSPADVRRLHRTIKQVLAEAIAAGGSSVSDYRTADNTTGWFQYQHRVYDHAGEPCRRCGTPIKRLVVAGRGTFICPKCQPLSRARR
jgi:formamidopyrimidine-DNA glycosylase